MTKEPEMRTYKVTLDGKRGQMIVKSVNLPLALLQVYANFGYQEVKAVEEIEE